MVIDEYWKAGVVWCVFEGGFYVSIFGEAHGELCFPEIEEDLHSFLGLRGVLEPVEGERWLHRSVVILYCWMKPARPKKIKLIKGINNDRTSI